MRIDFRVTTKFSQFSGEKMRETSVAFNLQEYVDLSRLQENSQSLKQDSDISAVNDFDIHLKEALRRETTRGSPVSEEREKLASSLAATVECPQNILQLNDYIRDFLFKNPDNIREVAPLITDLRDSVKQGIISAKDAIEKLHSAAKELLEKFNSGSMPGYLILQNNQLTTHKMRSEEEVLSRLKEDAQHLRELAVKNLSLQSEVNSSAAQVWIQQIWPLNQADSIFNGGRDRQVPYNPDKGKPEVSLADREVHEWDEKFEAQWSQADETNVASVSNPVTKSSSAQNFVGELGTAVNPLSRGIPNGDRLFSEMVHLMQTNIHQGNQRMNLELQPEHFGGLKLKLTLLGEKMNARFLVDNKSVHESLVERMDELKMALSDTGVKMGDIKVALTNPEGKSVTFNLSSLNSSNRNLENSGWFNTANSKSRHFAEGSTSAWVV